MQKFVFRLTVLGVALFWGSHALAQRTSGGRQFSPGSWTNTSELPASRLRTQVEQLQPPARERALQHLRGFHFTTDDLPSLHADTQGGIFYACEFTAADMTSTTGPITGEAAVPLSPFPNSLVFHSRPSSANILYLNFNGETVTDTQWNATSNRTTFNATAFSTDGDFTTFSDSEQAAIKRIWQRVAEDYAPFDIDVTTERPGAFNNRTAHALITRSTDTNGMPNPSSNAGGVAYIDVFNVPGYANYRPAWIYFDRLGSGNESYVAEAVAHEVGHNMGLGHDSSSNSMTGYYGGHGSGDISWGPIMGTGYNQNVSQWSKGEYYQANNTEDDLALIAAKANYRADDYANTTTSATALVISGLTNVISTTPESDPDNANSANKGVIERNTDMDVFSFVTGNGAIRLAVNPWISPANTRGGNLDVALELRNDSGALLLASNPASLTTALIQTNLPAGRYYIYVKNTGAGSPLSASPTGYTSYGSIGQYFISGFIANPTGVVLPPTATLTVADITASGQGNQTFTVTYSDEVAVSVATVDSNDVRLTGPNGYNQLAQFVSLDGNSDGTPRTATYQVPPPSGSFWTMAHNGTYTITMLSNQVADVQNAFVAPAQLGQFQVTLPLTYYTANLNSNPGWTLEPLWAYGAPGYAPGTGPTNGYTGTNIIAYNLTGNYLNSLTTKSATTPVINCTGSLTLTLHFRRWLGLQNGDTASIEVSTNGTTWVALWSTTSNFNDTSWQDVQINLPAGFAGTPTLQVRWRLASNVFQTSIGWNLDDIEIIGTGTQDSTPPIASLSVSNLTVGGASNLSCTVTYTDAAGVSRTSIDSSDILVTGPGGYSNLLAFVSANLGSDGSPIMANYSIAAPGGTWDSTDNGTYTLTLLAGQVKDTLNNAVSQSLLGTFEVAIPIPGMLAVNPSTGTNSTGFVGGPFTPATDSFILTNAGGSTFNWLLSTTTNWLTLNPTNGSLAPGASIVITASFNNASTALPAGDYTNTVAFQNLTTGGGNSLRTVTLTVSNYPTVTLNLNASPAGFGSVSPTNGIYPLGTNIQLIATPAAYYQFANWSGDISGTTNLVSLTLTSNVTAQAQFTEILTTNFATPLWWLATNGFTNDFEAAAATIGANGHPLWQSYVAGFDPANPASQLLLSVAPENNGADLVFGWNTVTGRIYSLLASTNLEGGFWPVANATNLPWTVQSFTNVMDPFAVGTFFRLEVQKP